MLKKDKFIKEKIRYLQFYQNTWKTVEKMIVFVKNMNQNMIKK